MRTLHTMLNETDEAMRVAIAAAWAVTPTHPDAIAEAMLNAEKAEQMWERLTDEQRQALQTVLGGGGKMQMPMFKRLFGDIRRMGVGGIEREQPHKNPATAAEALFYRGFVGEVIQMGENGSQAFVYVPEDLVLVLPTHKTAYDGLEAPPQDPLQSLDVGQITETRRADTSIVDDMTTLLAFLQLHGSPVDGDSLAPDSLKALYPYLLTKGEARIAFMLTVGISADLIEIQTGRAYPRRADARQWLSANRSEQIERLINAWLQSTIYRELWHVPGLTIEVAADYNPIAVRKAVKQAIHEFIPGAEWWDVDEFIYAIKQKNPDFQRPNGDYDSWYIQDMSGEYVRGFESWDTVEGPLIEYVITGPMHWLGLLDVAPEAARLTAYGRGFAEMAAFPKVPDETEPVIVQEDGTLLCSRKATRIDRFQVARFTSWEEAPSPNSGDPFAYLLDLRGVRQADAQGIEIGHITAFLNRVLEDNPIPERIVRVLQQHQRGDAGAVTLEQLIVLRTTSEQVMDDIVSTPELRRFLGARLGTMACVVRADQWEVLSETLIELGIQVEVIS